MFWLVGLDSGELRKYIHLHVFLFYHYLFFFFFFFFSLKSLMVIGVDDDREWEENKNSIPLNVIVPYLTLATPHAMRDV